MMMRVGLAALKRPAARLIAKCSFEISLSALRRDSRKSRINAASLCRFYGRQSAM